LTASVLFPIVQQELARRPDLIPDLRGLFVLYVDSGMARSVTWYVLLRGKNVAPIISTKCPDVPELANHERHETDGLSLPVVHIMLDDSDLLTLCAGGINGHKLFSIGRLRVDGDLRLAVQLESVFKAAGGSQKTREFVSK
ncbi:hypothetical protein GQ42DRAFT_105734, partial [Ramicandelaber brevisporus]